MPHGSRIMFFNLKLIHRKRSSSIKTFIHVDARRAASNVDYSDVLEASIEDILDGTSEGVVLAHGIPNEMRLSPRGSVCRQQLSHRAGRKRKPTFLVRRACRLASSMLQKSSQAGRMDSKSWWTKIRTDPRMRDMAANASRSHSNKTRMIPKTSKKCENA